MKKPLSICVIIVLTVLLLTFSVKALKHEPMIPTAHKTTDKNKHNNPNAATMERTERDILDEDKQETMRHALQHSKQHQQRPQQTPVPHHTQPQPKDIKPEISTPKDQQKETQRPVETPTKKQRDPQQQDIQPAQPQPSTPASPASTPQPVQPTPNTPARVETPPTETPTP